LLRNRRWRCAHPPAVADATPSSLARCANSAAGHRCYIACRPGYSTPPTAPDRPPASLQCAKGQWANDRGEARCEPTSCARSPAVAHADEAALARCAGVASDASASSRAPTATPSGPRWTPCGARTANGARSS
jgi:hypothetical protein